jgi:hypothetical protein
MRQSGLDHFARNSTSACPHSYEHLKFRRRVRRRFCEATSPRRLCQKHAGLRKINATFAESGYGALRGQMVKRAALSRVFGFTEIVWRLRCADVVDCFRSDCTTSQWPMAEHDWHGAW